MPTTLERRSLTSCNTPRSPARRPRTTAHRRSALTRPADAHDLCAKTTHLWPHPEVAGKMGLYGRERVLRHHDWDVLAEATDAVFSFAATAPLGGRADRASHLPQPASQAGRDS